VSMAIESSVAEPRNSLTAMTNANAAVTRPNPQRREIDASGSAR
jgi:hypothetical protein